MRIQPINSNNGTFRSVKIDDSANLSRSQQKVADSIICQMKYPDIMKDNLSAEQYYAAKGYDFSITPGADNDTVALNAHKKKGRKIESFELGQYDSNMEKFQTWDIEYGMFTYKIGKNNEQVTYFLYGFMGVFAATAIALLSYILFFSNKPQNAVKSDMYNKPLIENTNSFIKDKLKF